MQLFPRIVRPERHYRLIGMTMAFSAGIALLTGGFAIFNHYILPDWLAFDTERLFDGIAKSANPVVWLNLVSNLCLMIAAGLWIDRFHETIKKAAATMELAGATVLGTLFGYSLFQYLIGAPAFMAMGLALPIIFLGLSVLLRGVMLHDARGETVLKTFATGGSVLMFFIAQAAISGLD